VANKKYNMSNILFLSLRFPYPPQRGDRIRAYHFIKELSKKHDISMVSFFESEKEIEQIDELKKYCSKVEVVKFSPVRAYFNSAFYSFSSKPFQVGYWYSPNMCKKIEWLIESNDFDIIHAQFFRMAQYVTKYAQYPKVLDLADALSLNLHRRAKLDRGFCLPLVKLEEKRVRRYETEIIKNFDIGTMVSAFDRDYLLNLDESLKLSVIPMGVDHNYFSPDKKDYKQQVLFTGTMSYFPNYDAVLYFCKEIFPIIKKQLPDLSFYIVGNHPHRKLLQVACKDIVVTGYVPDVRPYFNDSAVFVCPLRSGSGMQAKNLEAMAMGVPIVTTSVGFEGLEAVPGKEILIADEPGKFADYVIQLIEDKEFRNEISENARRLVETKYSWHRIVKRLEQIYRQIS